MVIVMAAFKQTTEVNICQIKSKQNLIQWHVILVAVRIAERIAEMIHIISN